jgi:crotonobetainyl-CoA:carnitine CoA-transferase CaiB-like acyl-CoA transferase
LHGGMNMSGPLRGVRVLDLATMLTGPYAAALLADQGAEVIKVERPDRGDLTRWIGARHNGMTSLFLVCNRGKRAIAVDAHHPEGAEIIRQLAAESDVVIENMRPGVVERLGVDYETIRARNQDVVYASITGFGPVGPYSGRAVFDPVMQSFSGMAAVQADPRDGAPVFVRQTVADKATALFACQAVTAALFARANGDGGQHLHVSMADASVSFVWADSAGNEVLLDSDRSFSSMVTAGFEVMRFADGWGSVTPTGDESFGGLCRALDVDAWSDPRLATMAERGLNMALVNEVMDLCFAAASNFSMAEASKRFEAEGVSYAMVQSPAELPDDPHAQAMGLFEEYEHPVAGRIRHPRHPIQFYGTPAALTRDAPVLGQHTDEVLEELGIGDRIGELRSAGVIV